jgi:hypothetical protein
VRVAGWIRPPGTIRLTSPASWAVVSVDHVGERPLVEVAQQLGGGRPARPIEPHVQRRVSLEREAALGAVEVQRRDAEVEQHPVGGGELLSGGDVLELLEVRVDEADALAERRQPLARDREHLRVGVEAEESAVRRRALEHGCGVAAGAECAVDVTAAGAGHEGGERLLEQDGDVDGVGHPPGRGLVRF